MDRRLKALLSRWGVTGHAVLLATVAALSACGDQTGRGSRSPPSFAAPKSYATADSAESLAIGDLNGDGRPELATASPEHEPEGNVSVLVNRGDGRFEAKVDYDTAFGATSIAIADLNDDGKPDLATANRYANTVSVLVNKGDGTFKTKVDFARRGVYALALGDFNGDGKPDLALLDGASKHGNTATSRLSVLLNEGDGNFQARVDGRTGDVAADSFAIGDLNRDGKPDVATASEGPNGTLSVLLNRGDGRFQAKVDYGARVGTLSVDIGDVNGDGTGDLVTASDGAVSVLMNRGDGRFQARHDYTDGGKYTNSIAIGDLNGDGKPDLATAKWELDKPGITSVFLNRGDGTFRAKLDYPTGREPYSVVIGDLNGDGKPDVVTSSDAGTVSVLLNTSD